MSAKRCSDDLVYDAHPGDFGSPSTNVITSTSSSSKLPRREYDDDISVPAPSSRHDGQGESRAAPPSALSMPDVKTDMSEVDAPPSQEQPQRRSKGKGKMVYLPELPEEVWRRVWAIYYQDCATRMSSLHGTKLHVWKTQM